MSTKKKTKSEDVKKVCLLGSASDSKDAAPFDDPSVEIWGLAWRLDIPRFDRMFDIHHTMGEGFKTRQLGKKIGPRYIEHLDSLEVEVVLQQPHPKISKSVGFPFEQAREFLRQYDPESEEPEYFASSIAYMFVLAMMEGYHEIHMYGIDLIDEGEEYGHQRPNLEYLIGLARARGHNVIIAEKSALCKFPYNYGYDDFKEDEGIITIKTLQNRVSMYTERHQKAMCEAFTADGARQEAQHLLNILKGQKKGRKP